MPRDSAEPNVTDLLVERLPVALASGEPGPHGALPLREHGQFHHHLAPYFARFERRQIKVVLFDDMTSNGPALFRDGFRPFFLAAGVWAAVAVPLILIAGRTTDRCWRPLDWCGCSVVCAAARRSPQGRRAR